MNIFARLFYADQKQEYAYFHPAVALNPGTAGTAFNCFHLGAIFDFLFTKNCMRYQGEKRFYSCRLAICSPLHRHGTMSFFIHDQPPSIILFTGVYKD